MYYGARYYLPGLRRFISADTIVPGAGNSQAFNRYSYVLNNPIRYLDPTGHLPIPTESYDVLRELEYTHQEISGAGIADSPPKPARYVPYVGGDQPESDTEEANPKRITLRPGYANWQVQSEDIITDLGSFGTKICVGSGTTCAIFLIAGLMKARIPAEYIKDKTIIGNLLRFLIENISPTPEIYSLAGYGNSDIYEQISQADLQPMDLIFIVQSDMLNKPIEDWTYSDYQRVSQYARR